ncbi:MAG: Smr/MutS family protein [Ectothiorhodospiraceae bacterium]|nr:Smr/MutS family protein [Ectothiorhodospiraceae bacterium]
MDQRRSPKSTRRRGDLDPEDVALFRRTVGEVRPVRHDRVHEPFAGGRAPARPRPRPARDLEAAGEARALPDPVGHPTAGLGESLWHARPGVSTRDLARLRRGKISQERELDLHGMRVAEARPLLAQFLDEARRDHVRCVRIVHGKGLRSAQAQPVIKSQVDRWLRLQPDVLAFCSARPCDGGTGALYVLLSRGPAAPPHAARR